MQSGKILPVFRQFFSTPKTGASTRDRDPQQGGGQQPERDATEEEARRAAEILGESEEFKKNHLSVTVGASAGGGGLITVRDQGGAVLRVIKGLEIVRVLVGMGTPEYSRQGRILDRRI